MARLEGLEPPAYRFEVCRSIQLSYRRRRISLHQVVDYVNADGARWLGYFAAFVCYTTASRGGDFSLAVASRCPIVAAALEGQQT